MSEADKKSENKPERALFVEWTVPPKDRKVGPVVADLQDQHLISIEGFVKHLGPKAEVALHIEGGTKQFFMPRTDLDRLGINEGDSFWFDIFQRDGALVGRIRAPEPTIFAGPNVFDSPDELSARAGRGP